MTKITTSILLLLTSATLTLGAEINPFTTDGCSRFPDGTVDQPQLWRSCCVNHDRAYWMGGSYQERIEADLELQRCVTEVGQRRIGELMFLGVRMGGSPFWPTDYRWGYGWPYLRGYDPLTEEELMSVKKRLEMGPAETRD